MSAAMSERAPACLHCQYPVDSSSRYCCSGCAAAHQIIEGAGLAKFYELRGDESAGPPRSATFERSRERLWLESLSETVAQSDDLVRIEVGIGGLFCAACVWLIERAAARHPGLEEIVVNPARGTAVLTVTREFDLDKLAEELEQLGYRLVPPKAASSASRSELLARTGIASAIALNSMLLAAAVYLGLESGALYRLFIVLSALLGVGSLIVGAGYFGRRALAALRTRSVSLDVPIALGIVLVFAASAWGVVSGQRDAIYFDTLSVFVALMLAGRLLQERLMRANRDRIAASEELLDLSARVIRDGRPVSVSATTLEVDDQVLVPPGEVVPTDIRLEDERAGCRLDWISGESAPRLFRRGEVVSGGAINASKSAINGTVVSTLADTNFASLLATPRAAAPSDARLTSGPVAAVYLGAVLLSATLGFVVWLSIGAGLSRALEVTAAVLVVTCPCALGIGVPLAFELTVARLARVGAFIQTPSAIAKLSKVEHIAFDKTGTVTEASLVVDNPEVLRALSESDRHLLFNLAARSAHPHSVAIANALDGSLDSSITATEEVGAGVSAVVDGAPVCLGREDWATGRRSSVARATVYARDGVVVASPEIVEKLRPDASAELEQLASDGYRLSLVSGDRGDRVREVAERLGLSVDDVFAEALPLEKSDWVKSHDRGDLLFVGDGLNDAPALEAATVSATPSFESPLVAERVDLYFNGRGLRPIRLALEAARSMLKIRRAQLGFVIIYNAVVVTVALAGWMKPWLAAVLMPSSSVAVIALTTLAVHRGLPWKS